jgi:hypothetical protein
LKFSISTVFALSPDFPRTKFTFLALPAFVALLRDIQFTIARRCYKNYCENCENHFETKSFHFKVLAVTGGGRQSCHLVYHLKVSPLPQKNKQKKKILEKSLTEALKLIKLVKKCSDNANWTPPHSTKAENVLISSEI